MYKHVTWQHLNQYMTSKSRGHCDNIKVFNKGKSNQIREKSGKNQGIWLLKMCGHTVFISLQQIPKEDYLSAFRDWVKRLQKCVYWKGEYLKVCNKNVFDKM